MRGSAVRLFSLSTCIHCKSIKRFLDSKGIRYECTDVDLFEGAERQELLAEVKRYNPRCTFPTLLIGDQVFVGFRETELSQLLEEAGWM